MAECFVIEVSSMNQEFSYCSPLSHPLYRELRLFPMIHNTRVHISTWILSEIPFSDSVTVFGVYMCLICDYRNFSNVFLQRYYAVMGNWYWSVSQGRKNPRERFVLIPIPGKMKKNFFSVETWSPWKGMKVKHLLKSLQGSCSNNSLIYSKNIYWAPTVLTAIQFW